MSPSLQPRTDPATDIAALAAPLDPPPRCGPDLRLDPAYRAIQEARREQNARLPQGVWAREIKQADWPLVERLCSELLRDRTKDLLLACWLTEAKVHREGFAGLAPGLSLLTALCRGLWPDLHPAIEDGDLAPRLAPFEWLNARLPPLLHSLKLVRSASNPELAYSWTDHVNAQLLDGLRQRDPKSVERSEAAGAVTLAALAAARQATDTGFWREIAASLRAAAEALGALNASLEELCGRDAPGLGRISDAIADIANLTSAALSERLPPRSAASPAPLAHRSPSSTPPLAAPMAAPMGAPMGARGAPMTREDAYEQLAEIARLLHRLEPHSPVPYLIDRAVAWGEMSFASLIMHFSQAGLDFRTIFEVLGLAEPDELEEKT